MGQHSFFLLTHTYACIWNNYPTCSKGLLFSRMISPQKALECPDSMKTCCYDQELDLGAAGVTCVSPEMSSDDQPEEWSQHCPKKEPMMSSRDQCGLRQFHNNEGDIRLIIPGYMMNYIYSKWFCCSSPGEFPWSCLILTEENGFVGNCALIPGRDLEKMGLGYWPLIGQGWSRDMNTGL